MFTKILIANRGEIACRVARTAREMGVRSVAVYSDADAGALHVRLADQAVHIGGSAPAESYLNGGAIITAALKCGVQAIHPGYGFLSENPDFVDDVNAAGLVFIGPSAASIRAMGLKDAAKKLMEKAGVPVVPGYHGTNQDAGFLAAQAQNIGYPVLIKAVAGGGGKGMRLVVKSGEFAAALTSARAEAQTSFANDAVLVEKYIEKPRHIEIQVFGDGSRVVHLFERDCSLQRRHQKVIEEAPAPGMTEDMRAAMCDAAIRAARATHYSGAGTVEFIVDASEGLRPDGFWFMEMNTRLQVEHPVTEAVTGVDLVAWQLRVAAGEPLPETQDQLKLNGHAIEARLYAEDPENGFLPATGKLRHLRFPDHVRIDTGVQSGDEISPYYDPMIAKITAHAPSREIALSQLTSALLVTELIGTTTNLTFLANLTRQPEFVNGNVDTDLIARNIDDLTNPTRPDMAVQALAAICAAGVGTGDASLRGFSLWSQMNQQINLLYRGQEFQAILAMESSSDATVTIDGQVTRLCLVDRAWVAKDGSRNLYAKRFDNLIAVFGQATRVFDLPDQLQTSETDEISSDVITAPMPGLIKAVFASPNQSVTIGDRLMVLEAMKMEHVLSAPRDGQIAEVLARVDDQVAAGAPLITFIKAGK